MKRTPLLSRQMSALVAELGHLDEVVVADAGLPSHPDLPVIDLAVSPNLPALFQVLDALKSEMVIEAAVQAEERSDDLGARIDGTLRSWERDQGLSISLSSVPHSAFKDRANAACALIRTGDFTPYTNLILISGVPF